MTSHLNAGQFNLRGKRSMQLPCGCCDAIDKRDEYERSRWRKAVEDTLGSETDSRTGTVAPEGEPRQWSE